MLINDLLEECKKRIMSQNFGINSKVLSGDQGKGFEQLVVEILQEIVSEDKFRSVKIIPKFAHFFPDIEIECPEGIFGLELKFRKSGEWSTNGGTIFESQTNNNLKNIFLMFGAYDKKIERILVKIESYWKSITGIAVTHSPRYQINLNSTKRPVFENWNKYNDFRLSSVEDKTNFFAAWARSNIPDVKWYNVNPTWFNTLDHEIQLKLTGEAFALFPMNLLLDKHAHYSKVGMYWLDAYYVANKSLRDVFSAGGQVEIDGFAVPKILKKLQDVRKYIQLFLTTDLATEKLEYLKVAWGDYYDESICPWENYVQILNIIGNDSSKYLYKEYGNCYASTGLAKFLLKDLV